MKEKSNFIDKGTSRDDNSVSMRPESNETKVPESAADLDKSLIISCLNMDDVYIPPDHPTLAVIDHVIFSKPNKCLLCYPSRRDGDYKIPQGIRKIADKAFSLCLKLSGITIPDSVVSIGKEAFNHSGLRSEVIIPESVISIGDGAFSSCGLLTKIVLPKSISHIEDGVFEKCSDLMDVTIPDSVTSIGNRAFLYCESLADITIPDSVTSIGENAFMGCHNLTLTVSHGGYAEQYCKENYLKYTYTDSLDWLND